MNSSNASPQPLAGIRVLDFSQNLAGPYATQILADWGAEVLKVEPPGGDPARAWGPPFIDGDSPLFQVVNRNKRRLELNLKDSGDLQRALELAEEADVVVQALRHGVAERLGIGADEVRRRNPGAIYVSVTSYGSVGPFAREPGYDPLMQARSGLMSITGHPDSPPARAGASVIDLPTGIWTAVGVMGALLERERTGKGCHVETSLLDTSLALMSYHFAGYLAGGPQPARQGSAISMIAPYAAFPTSDGEVMLAAGNDRIFSRLLQALGLESLKDDERFATNALRVAHRDVLGDLIAAASKTRATDQLLKRLAKFSVPAAPIQSLADAARDPAVLASGMLREATSAGGLAMIDIPAPIRIDGARLPFRRPPPAAAGKRRADGSEGPASFAGPPRGWKKAERVGAPARLT